MGSLICYVPMHNMYTICLQVFLLQEVFGMYKTLNDRYSIEPRGGVKYTPSQIIPLAHRVDYIAKCNHVRSILSKHQLKRN